jgi:hypothetical protein
MPDPVYEGRYRIHVPRRALMDAASGKPVVATVTIYYMGARSQPQTTLPAVPSKPVPKQVPVQTSARPTTVPSPEPNIIVVRPPPPVVIREQPEPPRVVTVAQGETQPSEETVNIEAEVKPVETPKMSSSRSSYWRRTY